MGNVSPLVKEHIPRHEWKNFPMPKKRLAPRYVLAENLKALIEANKTTAPRVAEKAGLDRKTINNMLNGRYNPNLDVVESVASVFGLNGWQILRHDLKDSLVQAHVIDQLIEYFYAASPEDREKISGVAEMAAKYKKE
jgi:transcriptional regulator with XRE-family HTH domain